MVFALRWCPVARVSLATATSFLLLLLSGCSRCLQSARDANRIPCSPLTSLPPAWLEFGPDGRLIARVIVDGECPSLVIDDLDVDMTRRAPASDAFPVTACEATVPFGTSSASILNQDLPLPRGPIRRIAVIGDTGCRVNDWEKKYQACNDSEAWPFARVAESVADWHPDLIVHVGDYLYRESPCPTNFGGCEGNLHGDNWATWDADFFDPAASLLGSAPGSSCAVITRPVIAIPRDGFTFLDPRTVPTGLPAVYRALRHATALVPLSRSSTPPRPPMSPTHPQETAEYGRQFELLGQMAGSAHGW